MSRDQQRLLDYLLHILEAIERIERYTADVDELAFLNTPLVQDAVVRNLEVIGEASRNVEQHYPDFARQHPSIPFAFAYQMRNAVAHGYFKVDYDIVWKTIQNDLAGLYASVQAARAAIPGAET